MQHFAASNTVKKLSNCNDPISARRRGRTVPNVSDRKKQIRFVTSDCTDVCCLKLWILLRPSWFCLAVHLTPLCDVCVPSTVCVTSSS